MLLTDARADYVRWLAISRDLSAHTIRAYDSDVKAFERVVGVHAAVEQIDRDKILMFIETLKAASLSPKSIRRRMAGLRGFFVWLRADHAIDTDPSLEVHVAAARSHDLPRVVAKTDIDRLFSLLLAKTADSPTCKDRSNSASFEATTLLGISLMLATGVRVSELVGIKTADVEIDARTIRIIGKGRRERVVYLPNDWITNLVRTYLDLRRAHNVSHEHLLFNRRQAPLSAAAMRSRLANAAAAAQIDRKVTPHMLRHTAATRLIEAGVDIRLIQRLLGHASLSTTEIYTHVSDQTLQQVLSDADVLGHVCQGRLKSRPALPVENTASRWLWETPAFAE